MVWCLLVWRMQCCLPVGEPMACCSLWCMLLTAQTPDVRQLCLVLLTQPVGHAWRHCRLAQGRLHHMTSALLVTLPLPAC